MSKKRAFIDAVLSATRSSGIFTQDIEDIEDTNNNLTSNNTAQSTQKVNNSNMVKPSPITREQQSQIFVADSKNNIPLDYVKSFMIEKYNINESKLLNSEQAEDLTVLLKNYAVI